MDVCGYVDVCVFMLTDKCAYMCVCVCANVCVKYHGKRGDVFGD